MGRGIATFAVGVVVGGVGLAVAQPRHDHAAGPAVKAVSAVDMAEELDGKPVTAATLEVTFEPGAAGAPHRHPGPVFGYVLEGELEFQAGDGPLRRLKAGKTFYEPARTLHAVSRNPSDRDRTRVLAVMIHPRDEKDLVIPEPADGGP